MELFLVVYPYVVLTLGLFTAAAVAVIGAIVTTLLLTQRAPDVLERFLPALWVIVLSNLGVVIVLSFTRWMLIGV